MYVYCADVFDSRLKSSSELMVVMYDRTYMYTRTLDKDYLLTYLLWGKIPNLCRNNVKQCVKVHLCFQRNIALFIFYLIQKKTSSVSRIEI